MGKHTGQVNEPRPLPPTDILPNEIETSYRGAARAVGGTRSELKSRSPLAERVNASPIHIPVHPSEPERNPQSRSAYVSLRLEEPNDRSQLDAIACVTRSISRSGATPSIPVNSSVARVATSSNSSPLPPPARAPEVRVLLCADESSSEAERVINSNDIKCFKAACVANIPGLKKENIRTNLLSEGISTAVGGNFRWFFNPDDIVPGDMLILLVTGHGYLNRVTGIVSLKLFTSGGIQIDTTVLNSAISKLPKHCTLEIVLGTCFAEGLVSGFHRIETMGASSDTAPAEGLASRSTYGPLTSVGPGRSKHGVLAGAPLVPTDNPPPTSLLGRLGGLISLRTSSAEPHLDTSATVIIWAAASATGETFAEVLLPQRIYQLCVMIGAIYRAWRPGKSEITRREVCAKIRKANLVQDRARLEYYASHPGVPMPAGAGEPGLALLLCSSDDRERVLDSPIFQPLDPPLLHKSLVGGSSGSSAGEK